MPGCRGNLAPTSIKSKGLGGAISITYLCSGCVSGAVFDSSAKHDPENTNEISLALRVAFVISGCMHSTYVRVLHHSLGMDACTEPVFQSTIRMLYPIVKEMVDEHCKVAKEYLKSKKQDELGSWDHAVTCADGTWMTRSHHSKNATFSIRDYLTGALLYYKHLCQHGRDEIVEDLYEGTSKSAEGFAACQTFQEAKKDGINIVIHWQDADSSSSNAVSELFPDTEIMICGGHTKQLFLHSNRVSVSR